jgi:hypothetical protein
MGYLQKLAEFYADPATHNFALVFALFWARLEALNKRQTARINLLARRVSKLDGQPPGLPVPASE